MAEPGGLLEVIILQVEEEVGGRAHQEEGVGEAPLQEEGVGEATLQEEGVGEATLKEEEGDASSFTSCKFILYLLDFQL